MKELNRSISFCEFGLFTYYVLCNNVLCIHNTDMSVSRYGNGVDPYAKLPDTSFNYRTIPMGCIFIVLRLYSQVI